MFHESWSRSRKLGRAVAAAVGADLMNPTGVISGSGSNEQSVVPSRCRTARREPDPEQTPASRAAPQPEPETPAGPLPRTMRPAEIFDELSSSLSAVRVREAVLSSPEERLDEVQKRLADLRDWYFLDETWAVTRPGFPFAIVWEGFFGYLEHDLLPQIRVLRDEGDGGRGGSGAGTEGAAGGHDPAEGRRGRRKKGRDQFTRNRTLTFLLKEGVKNLDLNLYRYLYNDVFEMAALCGPTSSSTSRAVGGSVRLTFAEFDLRFGKENEDRTEFRTSFQNDWNEKNVLAWTTLDRRLKRHCENHGIPVPGCYSRLELEFAEPMEITDLMEIAVLSDVQFSVDEVILNGNPVPTRGTGGAGGTATGGAAGGHDPAEPAGGNNDAVAGGHDPAEAAGGNNDPAAGGHDPAEAAGGNNDPAAGGQGHDPAEVAGGNDPAAGGHDPAEAAGGNNDPVAGGHDPAEAAGGNNDPGAGGHDPPAMAAAGGHNLNPVVPHLPNLLGGASAVVENDPFDPDPLVISDLRTTRCLDYMQYHVSATHITTRQTGPHIVVPRHAYACHVRLLVIWSRQ